MTENHHCPISVAPKSTLPVAASVPTNGKHQCMRYLTVIAILHTERSALANDLPIKWRRKTLRANSGLFNANDKDDGTTHSYKRAVEGREMNLAPRKLVRRHRHESGSNSIWLTYACKDAAVDHRTATSRHAFTMSDADYAESFIPAQRQPWEQNREWQKRPAIRILIVEKEPVYREGLHVVLESQQDMQIVGKAATTPEAIAEFRRHRPDITLMEHCVPDGGNSNLDPLRMIREEFSDARIIMLTAADGDAEIQRALRAGAASYVLKNAPNSELLNIIRSVHLGRKPIPPAVAARLAEHMGCEDLTPREIQVLKLVRDGNKNKQIAHKLSISETTVNFHIRNVVDKLQANDRTHAVTIALRRGHLPMHED